MEQAIGQNLLKCASKHEIGKNLERHETAKGSTPARLAKGDRETSIS